MKEEKVYVALLQSVPGPFAIPLLTKAISGVYPYFDVIACMYLIFLVFIKYLVKYLYPTVLTNLETGFSGLYTLSKPSHARSGSSSRCKVLLG